MKLKQFFCVVLMVATFCPCVAYATTPKVEEKPKCYYVTETYPDFVDFRVSTRVNEHGDYIVDVFAKLSTFPKVNYGSYLQPYASQV